MLQHRSFSDYQDGVRGMSQTLVVCVGIFTRKRPSSSDATKGTLKCFKVIKLKVIYKIQQTEEFVPPAEKCVFLMLK